ncbi:MAG: GNAT family N-acetyltransferase [bacterium]|nr:GNAT family N-acetyltransferase [bacterium]MDD5757129.1 GNAT family N-acetyltransferase [bacterium]
MVANNLLKYIKDIEVLTKKIGLRRVMQRLLYVSHEEILLVKDFTEVENISSARGLKVSLINRASLQRIALFRKKEGLGGEDPLLALTAYLDNGFYGYSAEINGEFIGYIWWGDSKTNFDFDRQGYGFYTHQVKMTPTDTFGFDLFVSSKHRNARIALEFLSQAFFLAKKLGYQRNYGYVHNENKPARWIYSIVGFKEIRRIRVRRLFVYFLFKDKSYFKDIYGKEWLLKTGKSE